MELPRLRQAVLAARDLDATCTALREALDLGDPFHDVGVGHFGLQNAVYALGDCFVEVVSPTRPDTAAGRRLDRAGGDCGYMAMFEVADADAARRRLDALGVRVVWETVHDDIVDLHLHPKDVPGAIVSLDAVDPPGSWRWGGPAWTAVVPEHQSGGLRGIVVRAQDPTTVARLWADLLDVPVTGGDTPAIALDGGRQLLRFIHVGSPDDEGISEVTVTRPGAVARSVEIGGVTFHIQSAEE